MQFFLCRDITVVSGILRERRTVHGYCYRDIWSIDRWFLTVVPNMIHDLRVNSHGYPSFFEGPEEENIRKWDRILGRKENAAKFAFRSRGA